MATMSLAVLCLLDPALASPFDPHALPQGLIGSLNPFFTGWFARLIDHDRNLSVACIFGSFKPERSHTYNTTWLALLYKAPGKSETVAEQHFIDQSKVLIQPRSDVTPGTPSSFVWEASDWGRLEVNNDTALIDFRFQSLRFRANLSRRVPWDARQPDAAGPEGWAGRDLPTPCHYYVHSLASRASYELQGEERSITGEGFAHLESNYGKRFPDAWVWTQAIDRRGEAQLLLSGGRFILGPAAPEVYVLAYRSPTLHWDFRRTDLDFITRRFSASSGFVRLVARHLLSGRELQVNVSAPPGTFSEPLFFPTRSGFSNRPGCQESYSAAASIAAYERGRLVEARSIQLAALEFGGAFRRSSAVGGEHTSEVEEGLQLHV